MFEQPTVIITGAGSSMEFGLPSGKDIFEALKTQARAHHQSLQPQPKHSIHRLRSADSFIPVKNFTFAQALGILDKGEIQLLKRQLLDINGTIDVQFDNSIDEYLYNNETYNRVGKLLSIWRLYCSLYNEAFDVNRHKKILSLRSEHMIGVSGANNSSRTWLASLAHKITQGCQTVEDLQKNKLSILTFNYDSYIEKGLLSLIKASNRFSKLENLDFIEIIHINGQLKLSDTFELIHNRWDNELYVEKSAFLEIDKNTKNIVMVNEPISKVIEQDRKQAVHHLKIAEKVFVLGFAFDPNNVATIGLNDTLDQTLFALNYDGNIQLKNRIRSVGENHNTIIGSSQNKIGCHEAAINGFFDQ